MIYLRKSFAKVTTDGRHEFINKSEITYMSINPAVSITIPFSLEIVGRPLRFDLTGGARNKIHVSKVGIIIRITHCSMIMNSERLIVRS
jgi:hypothetical protein